jgi:hypothetical protein
MQHHQQQEQQKEQQMDPVIAIASFSDTDSDEGEFVTVYREQCRMQVIVRQVASCMLQVASCKLQPSARTTSTEYRCITALCTTS